MFDVGLEVVKKLEFGVTSRAGENSLSILAFVAAHEITWFEQRFVMYPIRNKTQWIARVQHTVNKDLELVSCFFPTPYRLERPHVTSYEAENPVLHNLVRQLTHLLCCGSNVGAFGS